MNIARLYVKRIKEGIITFDEVPDKWKIQVKIILQQEGG